MTAKKWPPVRLMECVDLRAGFAFKSESFTDSVSDLPLVKGENVGQGEILWSIAKRWPARDWEALTNFHLLPGDVVLAMDRPWVPAGLKWGFIREGDPKALLVQRCARLRPANGRIDQTFLRFVIGSPNFENYLRPITTGVNVPHISGRQILDFTVALPPLAEQRRIARILSAYDELIENSRHRVRILERMARALYREWFVELRFPGYETVSPGASSRVIPQGWQVKKLGEILELNYGKALKKEHRRGGACPVFGSSGVVGFHDERLVKGPGIILGRKGNVGTVFWSDDDFFVIDTAYFVTSSLPLRFLFYDLQTKNFVNGDAAVPGLSRHQAYSLETLVPPPHVLHRFCRLADDFERQGATLRRQIENLRRTRDLLLARLLSGHMTLDDTAE